MVYSVHTKVVVHAFLLFSNFSLQYSLSIAWIALDNPPEALVEPQDPPQGETKSNVADTNGVSCDDMCRLKRGEVWQHVVRCLGRLRSCTTVCKRCEV